ncbi:MAG: hypothetical protein EPN48_11200 [Microbacteriaceae bacterium]|nr:MAG: hypothetical protein EPN48_11200 [Microbacteriaceae bacterium]
MPFGVGDSVSWKVVAADLAASPEGSLPRFVEVHDGLAARDVPWALVSGTVVTITGLYYPHTPDSEQHYAPMNIVYPFSRVLQRADEPDAVPAGAFRVQLEIPASIRLPNFSVNAQTTAQRRIAADLAGLDRGRRGDTVSMRLEGLAEEVQQRWGRVADVRRSLVSSAVTMIPQVAGGCVIGWSRQEDADQDCLRIHAGEGAWVFPAEAKFVEVLGEFVAAAAAGRVEEQVRPFGGPVERLLTVVYAGNGYTWTATTAFEPFDSENSSMPVGSLWQRAQRGDHDYLPWTAGA